MSPYAVHQRRGTHMYPNTGRPYLLTDGSLPVPGKRQPEQTGDHAQDGEMIRIKPQGKSPLHPSNSINS